ncbi:hypothetical protein N7539_005082 [Penicillium diatomitis]|uniref:RRM domain-containing protein n=1 Tax=Penicillium diatomitis TaxID=2819901 RepID=A0A9W9X653_9EURO|nr:uncharacterized protein N7539_005082 [Penicillium diatomitis]KAJ5485094.1 hypothetical protein N7539_005082 [Penicillium diatomitis]
MAKKQQQPQAAVSFDAIIQNDRRKKQNEQLASQILGKNRIDKGRRASAPGPGQISETSNTKPGSLASRIGAPKVKITQIMDRKRSASVSARPKQTNNKITKSKSAPAPAQSMRKNANSSNQRRVNVERLQAAIESSNHQAALRSAPAGISIKGSSGPFMVVGSNFAPGTTAADIQSAIEPVAGPMLTCRVISHHPGVTAEFAFAERWCAENAVANFHNQRADGRILTLKLQPAGTPISTPGTSFNALREQADRERRSRRAEPQVQDGRYGFDEAGDALNTDTGLYSDQMMVDPPSQKNHNWRKNRR